jgi:hypothetical protein
MEDNKTFNNRMNIKYFEEEYNTQKMIFLIDNPEKTERHFIESKIEQFNQLELEYKRKCLLSDDEVYQEIKKTGIVASYIEKGLDKTKKKDFEANLEDHFLKFRRKYIYKEKEEEGIRSKFYKAKLKNSPNTETTKEEIEREEKTPYKIALLKELGFFELDKIKKLSKENSFKIIQKLIGGTPRTIKGNINVLNEDSKEDRNKYTSNNHFEEVKKYLDKLK